MGIDLEQEILDSVKRSIGAAIKEELSGYNKPLTKYAGIILDNHKEAILQLLDDSLVLTLNDATFIDEVHTSIRKKTASTLISKYGGEIEKRVNDMRANPVTRAKITLAMETLINSIGEA